MLVSSVQFGDLAKRFRLENDRRIATHRFACLGPGDDVVYRTKSDAHVICQNGTAQLLPVYRSTDQVVIGRRNVPVTVKEIETEDELRGYAQLAARRHLLIVWPDRAERRASLALATAVICDSVLKIGAAKTHGRILYIGEDSAVREQFAAVHVGRTALRGVFVQEFGKGAGQLRREGPYSTLPVVTTILSPVDPAAVIRSLRPRWIAADCGGGDVPAWLSQVVESAKTQNVPVIAWTTHHISSVVQRWRGLGGAILCWPKVGTATHRFPSIDLLAKEAASSEVVPLVLEGGTAKKLSNDFAACYHQLARHAGRAGGRLYRDAMSVAWRYLRLLESVPVPIEIYEVERVHSWGMPPLFGLRRSLERFVEALSGDAVFGKELEQVLHGLAAIHDALRTQADPPMWFAAAKLAAGSHSPRRLIFPNRAFREMFRFALLGRRNVAEADLRARGASLEALSDRGLPDAIPRTPQPEDVTLVGLPSRLAEWRMDPLFEAAQFQVLLWPHLEGSLARRVSDWSAQLEGGCEGPMPLRLSAAPRSHGRVRLAVARTVTSSDASSEPPPSGPEIQQLLWKRPDAAEAIRALFESTADEEDPTTTAGALMSSLGEGEDVANAEEDDWVEEALQVGMDDGSRLLLPIDEQVNVIVRSPNGTTIAPRFCRSLRVGDEVLLVHGQHRRSLYDLLLSRVHRHRLVAPWLMLIERWQDDIRRAFQESKRHSGMTLESLLVALRARGSSITTAPAVRGWVTGLTLAPSDPEDIRRLGDLFGLPASAPSPFNGRLSPGTREWSSLLDCYVTSLGYFSATRELDAIRTDLDSYVSTVLERGGLPPLRIAELSGSTSTDQVTATLELLESRFPRERPAPDAILATSMISHGVDVDRFNCMFFYGMPRQTAEYIQASSRVGRAHVGLVWCCLKPARERDQSHFEYFGKYHEFLGQLVEPVAINRWSKFSIQRTVPGLFMAVLLQRLSNELAQDNPNRFYMVDFVKKLLTDGTVSAGHFIPMLKEAYLVTNPDGPGPRAFSAEIDSRVRMFIQQILGAGGSATFVSDALVPRPMRSLRSSMPGPLVP